MIADIKDLVIDLGWDYQRMSQSGQETYEKLCELFNEETQNGKKMDMYTDLLKKAANEIIHIYKKRGNERLTTDRGALLIPSAKQISKVGDFELVTWLIIR